MRELTAPPAHPQPWLGQVYDLVFPVLGAYQTAHEARPVATQWLREFANVIIDPQSPLLRVYLAPEGCAAVYIGGRFVSMVWDVEWKEAA